MKGVTVRLVRTEQEWTELRAFAASFGHELPPGVEAFRMVSVSRGGRMVGYCQLIETPVMLPSIHTDPTVASPRDTAAMMCALRDWAAIQHGRAVFGISEQAPVKERSALERAGIVPMCERSLYCYEGG